VANNIDVFLYITQQDAHLDDTCDCTRFNFCLSLDNQHMGVLTLANKTCSFYNYKYKLKVFVFVTCCFSSSDYQFVVWLFPSVYALGRR
jgi:hypothetical protein